MTNPKLYAVNNKHKTANVFLKEAQGYYDRTAKKGARMTLLEGSILGKADPENWIYRDLELLASQGYIEQIGDLYKVVKPIAGSTSGTAAAVLGAGVKPAGYHLWKFGNGQSIIEAGEK